MKESHPFDLFDFDLAKAVLDQLVAAFDALPIGRLHPEVYSPMKRGQGVYQLFLEKHLVYIGKADKDLRGRLDRHYSMLSARRNIEIKELGFKALYIHRNWTTWATETALIDCYRGQTPWNQSGMGSNDPGHNREDTAEEETFNSRYPIDPDYVCDWIEPGKHIALDILQATKKNLPYLLRFHQVTRKFKSDADKQAAQELLATKIILKNKKITAKELLVEVAKQLPDGWQATQFPGRLILYKENVKYRHGQKLWPRP